MPNAAMKDEYRFMAGLSFRFRRALRIGRGARGDSRAGHIAAYGDATTVCLDVGRRRLRSCRLLRSFRLSRFLERKEMDKSRPKSRRHKDQPASDPPQNLLVALITQEPPKRVHDSRPAREYVPRLAQTSTLNTPPAGGGRAFLGCGG